MSVHIDKELATHFEGVRERLLRMAGLVERMIGDSVRALLEGNTRLADETIRRDQTVNRLQVEFDEESLLILARWQPVASDLRFLTIGLKMVTDLERIGDLAVNISQRAIDISDIRNHLPWTTLEEMTRLTRGMVHRGVDAFLQSSDQLAREVIATDDDVDELYARAFEEITDVMRSNHHDLQAGIHALSIIKWMERIADHATSLAELVVLMVKGQDIRHDPPGAKRSKRSTRLAG